MLLPGIVACLLVAAAPESRISPAAKDADGFLRHAVQCSFEAGETVIRVLLPEKIKSGRRYPLLLVLPVEAGLEHRYGDGLAEVRRLELHNRFGLIVAEPTFSHLPWYGDHPTDPHIRQESYLLKVVLPYLREHYAIGPGRENCLLLGFSKSGFGAWSLLSRHPELFERAAAWDAPLDIAAPDRFGMNVVFPTPESFGPYSLVANLALRAEPLRGRTRLGLFGYGNFRERHIAMHRKLEELHIPHAYGDGPRREHIWSSGWVTEAVEFLAVSPRRSTGGSAAIGHD